MAAALEDASPLTRSSSFEIIPPDMSELRVVLLGNSWTQRMLVGNLLLNNKIFSAETEPHSSTRVSGPLKDKKIAIINTPDLLQPDLTQDQLTELIEDIATASDPGPHVFLLVLQLEDFTQQQQQRLQAVLEKFSEHPFDHSMVLICTDREESPSAVYTNNQPLEKMIRKCRYRHMWLKNFEEEEIALKNFKLAELLSRLGQIVKENHGRHLNYEVYEAPTDQTPHPHTRQQETVSLVEQVQKAGLTAQDPTTRQVSEASPAFTDFRFRILLFGKSDNKKKILSKFITGGKSYWSSNPKEEHGEWRGKRLTVVKTPDLFSLSVEEVRKELKSCVFQCYPGPNVLLLLVKPSEFTETNRETLKFILTLLGPNAFKHSILILTHCEQMTVCVNKLLADCESRFYEIHEQNLSDLMEKIETMVQNNNGSFVTFTEGFSEEIKMSLNLVLCGRKGAGKTSAADAIFGSAASSVSSRPSECFKRQRELHGRWLSIVEMPALSGKPPQAAMEQYFNSISLCDPDGVHAFVLVLPVDPLTDEDKAEFKILRDTLGSRGDAFTMVLFTVESDPSAAAYTDFVRQSKDIQELCQSCRGRYLIFNIKDQQQVPMMLDKVERLTKHRNEPQSYTKQTFVQTQIEKITALQSKPSASETGPLPGDTQSAESLRIVLIGITGSGKSSSGNTILGRQQFKFDISQTSVTKLCQKAQSEVDGRRVEVVDTPGLFDSTMSNYEVNEEMLKCISLLAPGPHIFLLVLQIGRFTPEEKETLNLIKTGFGKDAGKFTIVLFTRGDDLEDFGLSLEDYVKTKCDDSCKKLISDCGNRCHVFNNREKDGERKQTQVRDLIKKIDAVVKANGGSCYTNEMLQEAEAAIQKEMQRLLKEKEEELRREMQEMETKHEQEMQEIKLRLEKQREEIEKERQERDKELKELEANINSERILRKDEQDKREEEDRLRKEQDKVTRHEYEQKLQELEVKIKMESKESFDRKLQESRDKMEQDREAWEKERKEWWDNRYKQDETRRREEHERLEKLEQEYKDKLETYRIKKEEEDRNRREQEDKERKELEERHERKVEELKKTYEEQARKKAEEFNEFKRKKEVDFAALIEKHLEEVTCLKEKITQGEEEYKGLQKLASHKETTLKSDIEELRKQHKHQMIDLTIAVLMEKKETNKKIREVQIKHEQEKQRCEEDIVNTFKQKEKDKFEKLKAKHLQEVKDLQTKTVGDDLKQRKKQLSAEHEKQLRQIKSDIWNQQKQELEERLDELEKEHEQELNTFTQELIMKHEDEQNKRIEELEKRQKEEMDKFMKKAGESGVEVDQLKAKHQQEINDIKKKMLPEEGWCSIL